MINQFFKIIIDSVHHSVDGQMTIIAYTDTDITVTIKDVMREIFIDTIVF